MTAAAEHLKKRQITSCLGRTGQHARRSRKHCKPCARHAHVSPPRARTRLHGFHSVRISIQPVPVHMNNDLQQQRDGAAETSRNDKLRVAWEGIGNTRAVCANTAKRAPNMLTHHRHVCVHVCVFSFKWKIQNNPYHVVRASVAMVAPKTLAFLLKIYIKIVNLQLYMLNIQNIQ